MGDPGSVDAQGVNPLVQLLAGCCHTRPPLFRALLDVFVTASLAQGPSSFQSSPPARQANFVVPAASIRFGRVSKVRTDPYAWPAISIGGSNWNDFSPANH